MNAIENFGKTICEATLPFLQRNPQICEDWTTQVVTTGVSGVLALGVVYKTVSACFRCFHSSSENLVYAASQGDLTSVNALIRNGIDVDTIESNIGITALHAAAVNGFTSIVKELCERGANPNIANITNNDTPLHFACQFHRTPVVNELLKHHAAVNAQNNQKQTPLMVAIEHKGNGPFYALLDANGIQLDMQDENGNTALHYGVKKSNDIFVRKLVDNGANANLLNQKDKLPLHIAAKAGVLSSVDKLLVGTFEKNQRDTKGRTPFYCAVEKFHEEASLKLLKEGDPNIPDNEGTYPIHIAMKGFEGDFSLALKLIESEKVDSSVKDAKGNTPAHIAAQAGAESVLEALQRKGVSFEEENSEHETPLGVALKHGKGVKILLESSSKEALEAMQTQGLALVDFAAIYRLKDLSNFLEEKEISFQLTETNTDALQKEGLKMALHDLKSLLEIAPALQNITDFSELIEEIEKLLAGEEIIKSEKLEQLELSIKQGLERLSLSGKHKREGTHSDRAGLFGAILPIKEFLCELLGNRQEEFIKVLKSLSGRVPLPIKNLLAQKFPLGKAMQYAIEAFQAFVPLEFLTKEGEE